MLNFILKKIVGTQNERIVRILKPTVDAINAFEPAVSKLSDAELRAKTDEFKARIGQNRKDYQDRLDEAVDFCRKAVEARSDVPRYAFTLAFYQQQKGDLVGATSVLNGLINKYPAYADAYVLLGAIYEKQEKKAQAEGVYSRGLAVEGMPEHYKVRMKSRLGTLKAVHPDPEKK